jgi:hypothetical protein
VSGLDGGSGEGREARPRRREISRLRGVGLLVQVLTVSVSDACA